MELEALLLHGETHEHLHVCADLLLEAGEAQGEVMAAQLAGERVPERERELEHLIRRVLGDLDEEPRTLLEWRHGFVVAVRWHGWDGFRAIADSFLELAALLDTPSALVPSARWHPSVSWSDRLRAWRLLCRLETLHVAPWWSRPNYDELWNVLEATGLPSSVRHLVAEDVGLPWQDEHQLTWVDLGDLSDAWPAMRALSSLRLRGSRPRFGAIDAPQLRSFELETSTLTEVDSFLTARWPNLERFRICFHDGRYAERQCELEEALAVVHALPSTVRALGLRNALFTEGLLEALAGSPRLAQLSELDVSSGVLLDGAPIFRRHAAAFRHLRLIDVSDTGLVVDEDLRAALPNLVVNDERRPKRGRYVSLSE